MRSALLAAAGMALLLSGCAMAPPQDGVLPLGRFEAFLTGRELAGPQTYLGPIPTAVVILKQGQTARNAALCQGYLAMPSLPEISEGATVATNAIPLRWLLKAEPQTPPRDCATLLAGYDFARAAEMERALSALPDAPGLNGVGPYFIEFMPDGSAVVIDGSAHSTAAVRQMAPQWLAMSGTTIQAPDEVGNDCLRNAAVADGSMADKAVAWLRCQFPDGVDAKVIRAVGCAAVKIIGGYALVLEGVICED